MPPLGIGDPPCDATAFKKACAPQRKAENPKVMCAVISDELAASCMDARQMLLGCYDGSFLVSAGLYSRKSKFPETTTWVAFE
jgi:hypothetical protein